MSLKKDFHDIMRKAEKQGWRIELSKKCHYRWYSPDGDVVHSSSTPSDFRAIHKHESILKRYGYKK